MGPWGPDVGIHADWFDVDGGIKHDNNNNINNNNNNTNKKKKHWTVRPTWSSSSEMAMPVEEDRGRN